MAKTELYEEVVGASPEVLRDQALRQLKKRRDFHAHLFVYAVVNIVAWGIWSVLGVSSNDWDPWPLWLTLAWGLGIVFNAWDVYARRPITEAEVRREMDRLGHRARGGGPPGPAVGRPPARERELQRRARALAQER
jgi:hypothetical protein